MSYSIFRSLVRGSVIADVIPLYLTPMPTLDKVPIEQVVHGIVLNDCATDSIDIATDLAGWTFVRANAEESARCSSEITKYEGLRAFGTPRQEMTITAQGNGHRMTAHGDRTIWRYSVVRPSENASINGAQLSEAMRLSDANLICELWHVRKMPNSDGPDFITGGHPAQCIQYLLRSPLEESHELFDTTRNYTVAV